MSSPSGNHPPSKREKAGLLGRLFAHPFRLVLVSNPRLVVRLTDRPVGPHLDQMELDIRVMLGGPGEPRRTFRSRNAVPRRVLSAIDAHFFSGWEAGIRPESRRESREGCRLFNFGAAGAMFLKPMPDGVQITSKSFPRITVPRKCSCAASIHIRSVTSGSSAGTKWERTSVVTPEACATRPASSADV